VLHLEHSILWCLNVDTSDGWRGKLGKFWNVVLEKNREDRLDQLCQKWGLLRRVKEERNVLRAIKRRKANCIGHILLTNCHSKHTIERKVERGREVIERQGRRRKQLLDNLKERRGLEIKWESTRSHSMKNSLWKSLWTYRKTDYIMNELTYRS
jgi:hypothetical protein